MGARAVAPVGAVVGAGRGSHGILPTGRLRVVLALAGGGTTTAAAAVADDDDDDDDDDDAEEEEGTECLSERVSECGWVFVSTAAAGARAG